MFFVLRDLASSTSNGNLSKGLNKEGKKIAFALKNILAKCKIYPIKNVRWMLPSLFLYT